MRSKRGFVPLSRRMFDGRDPIWESSEPFDRRSAWIDLVQRASRKTRQKFIGSVTITIERGQVWDTERGLADRWRWSRAKVRRFLDQLSTMQRVVSKPAHNAAHAGTMLTLLNYESYNPLRTSNRPTFRPKVGPAPAQHRPKMNKEGIKKEEEYVTGSPSVTDVKETSSQPHASVASAGGEQAEAVNEMTTDLNLAIQNMPAKVRRVAFRASASVVISGDELNAWRDPRSGDLVPWPERPRLFRLALARCASEESWGSGDLCRCLKYEALRTLDPRPPKSIPPDSPARQIGAELPQHHGGRTAAGLERPGQSIRDERREQEDRERAEDDRVAAWCRDHAAEAERFRLAVASQLDTPQWRDTHTAILEARAKSLFRERVLAAMTTAGAA
jgi:hypothetical protein